MNCTLSPNTSELFDAAGRANATPRVIVGALERMPCARPVSYTTVPMPVCKPVRSSYMLDEEELYCSFEQAISERVQSLHLIHTNIQTAQHGRKHHQCNARKMDNRQYRRPVGMPFLSVQKLITSQPSWQPLLLLAAFGLLCLLAGFDLMGLLILHAR